MRRAVTARTREMISEFRTTYGRDEAQTLIANTSVKCILRAGDAETL